MINSHFFDFETIVEVNSQCWIVDPTMPSIPILKISQSDFNLIKSGVYRSQNNYMNFGGLNFWIPTEIMELIKIKAKNNKADISNLIFSMQEFTNKELIENLDYDVKLDNIIHLKNTDDDIYIICSRNTKRNYELMISKIEEKLQVNGLKIKKFYFISETFYNRDSDEISHKKVRLLLQHVVGLKTDNDKFTTQELDKYDNIYFYDDEQHVINFAINCNKLLTFLLKNTEYSISVIIKEDLKSRKCVLIVNYVTNNKVNKFKTDKVNIRIDNVIKSFESFKYNHENLKLYESFKDIDSICKKYGITNYTINDDGSIDVDGNVNLNNLKSIKIPLKFRNVSGYFDCSYNQLTTLEGCPTHVGGGFYCRNNQLTTLEGCPTHVGGHFYCHNNQLTTLEGCPTHVGGHFYCSNNKLTTLEGCPTHVGGDFNCSNNQLTTLEGCPTHVDGYFNCSNNPVYNIWILFKEMDKIELFNDYDIIRGDSIVLDRLNEFLIEIGEPIVKNVNGYKII